MAQQQRFPIAVPPPPLPTSYRIPVRLDSRGVVYSTHVPDARSALSTPDDSSWSPRSRVNTVTAASTASYCSTFSSPASSQPQSDQQTEFLERHGSNISLKRDEDASDSLFFDYDHIPAIKPDLTKLPDHRPVHFSRPFSADLSKPPYLGLSYREFPGCLDDLGLNPADYSSPKDQGRDFYRTSSVYSGRDQTMSYRDEAADTSPEFGCWVEDYDENKLEPNVQQSIKPEALQSGTTHVAEEEHGAYDLKAPPPPSHFSSVETLAEGLFSLNHLQVILRDSAFYSQFSAFLSRYQPHLMRTLKRYFELQKALCAIDYANAIAESLTPGSTAAVLSEDFFSAASQVVEELVNYALPKYITHRLVLLSTDILVKEITKQNTPVMRDLVAGLAEVYCMTDPGLPDNPVVYASEEFFRYTQYSREYAIGRNCRFLQGPKSAGPATQRLIDGLAAGTEVCEILMNYRRDGSPFLNLLMIAPLHDNKGKIRYFIGAQIDVTGLVAKGKGLDSFERLLAIEQSEGQQGDSVNVIGDPQKALGNLSRLFDEKDVHAVDGGMERRRGSNPEIRPTSSVKPTKMERKFVGMDLEDAFGETLWPASELGSGGLLPGVFQNYLLVRPYPSLRITFTSPSLRIPGLPQSKFVDRIGGSSRIRDEIIDALTDGISVTARINWLPQGGAGESKSSDSRTVARPASAGSHASKAAGADGTIVGPDGQPGKPRWIHCTPLLGSDGKVGVWMVVLVESEFVTRALNVSDRKTYSAGSDAPVSPKPLSELSPNALSTPKSSGPPSHSRWTISRALRGVGRGDKLRSGKLYRDYLRREGVSDSNYSPKSVDSADN